MTRPSYEPIDFDTAFARHKARSPAVAAAHAAIEAQAKRTAAALVVARARDYAENPAMLDMIEPDLSKLRPRDLRYRLAALMGEEIVMQRRSGGETIRMNLAAAMMFAESLIEAEEAAE